MWPSQQMPNVGGRQSRSQYQFTLIDPDARSWTPGCRGAERRRLPGIIDVTTDREQGGLQANVVIDRTAARGSSTSGHRYAPTIRSRSARSRPSSPSAASIASSSRSITASARPSDIDPVYVAAAGGTQVPLGGGAATKSNTPCRSITRANIPRCHHLQSHRGYRAGDRRQRVLQAVAEMHLPDTIRTEFAGDMRCSASAASEEILILAALIGIYIVLGVLCKSLAHPFIASRPCPPRAGRAARPRPSAPGVDHRLHRHHLADRHRQEERHHAGRPSPSRASAAACPGSGDPPGLPPPVQPILMTTMSALLGAVRP